MRTKNPSSPSSPSLAAYRLHALTISKLSKSDYQSALKYAICAHEVDPSLPHLPLIITALKVLLSPPLDHYRTLLLPPFSSSSRIRSQFKSLSLTFKNPDLNFDGLDEAIRRIEESYRVLSDRELKKEFDDSLRSLEAEKDEVGDVPLQVLEAQKGKVSKSKLKVKKKSNVEDDDYEEDDEENEVEDADSRLELKKSKDRKRAVVEDFDSEEEEEYNSNNRLRTKRIRVRKNYSDEEYEYDEEEYNNAEQRSSRKVKVGKEKTLAQMQMELFNAKKRNKKAIIAIEDEEDDTSLMKVVDSDFYEFDNDRNEKSFVKGQIWAVYDGDDGMPRHYGLVEDVRTINSFKVKVHWMEIVRKDKNSLVLFENFGHYDTCGIFRLGSKVDICCINMFSHLVQSERAGKEVYRIYPRKGSVWAFIKDVVEEEKGEGRRYDIVVCLTSYSEMYGLSVAYLEKVDGYKTIFKRKAIGVHAITWLEKVNMFSHQIPARKLLGEEDENLPGECWELDPASLPSELLCSSNGD